MDRLMFGKFAAASRLDRTGIHAIGAKRSTPHRWRRVHTAQPSGLARASRWLGTKVFVPIALVSLALMNFSGLQGVALAATGAGVNGAVTYADTHWQWAIYDNSLPQVYSGQYQPQFQCAEFVSRALASSGPIGALTPTGPATDYANVTYNSATYNLNLVSGLYHFLLDTGAATDAGTSLSSATLGSVIIYGNTQDGDFLHTAIVTDTTNSANPLFTAHNAAYFGYPGTTVMYDEYGRQMPITHILQINYGLIAGGALQNSVGGITGSPVQMNAPAPYNGGMITSGISLSWQAVTGAQTYNVSLYDVNGRLIDGISTASASFSYSLSTIPYGVYDYIIQPESSSASFPLFSDEFDYEPAACLTSGASRNILRQAHTRASTSSISSSTSCGSGSGTAATSLAPTLSPAAVTAIAAPGVAPAQQTVTLTNPGTTPYSWQLGKEPSWVTVLLNAGTIPAGGSVTIALRFWYEGITPSSTPGTFTTTLQIFDTNGVYAPLSLPVTVVESNISTHWYFAEGYTGGSFTEYLTLANPGATSANVNIQYLLGSGPPITVQYYVFGDSRKTINVNNDVGSGQNVSMVVTSDQPIIAERPMYFTYTGLSGYSIPGGSDVLGATSLGTQYDFGYLDTSPSHATYLTILNPNSSAMTATVQYYPAVGGAPTTITHTIAANSRGTVNVNNEGLAPGSYSALVTLSAPGLVERPMYLVDSVTGYTGSANLVGVTQPLTAWYFAEGYTNTNFSERYILSNPSASATAHVTLTFYKSDGTTATASATLSPGQQQIISANSVLGNGVNNSASVTADQPVLAERFMSFTYHGPVGTSSSSQIPGATDVLGAAAPGPVFMFAEGYTGGSFGEYLTLENPNTVAAHVTVDYLPQNGATPTVVNYTVNPTSRYTVLTNQVMPSQSFSMAVFADQPIVAERPMYFDYGSGETGGSDVVGYQPVAPLTASPIGWNIQASPIPNQSSAYLSGVAAVSTNDVWEVGRYFPYGEAPLIAHWDGSMWSLVPSPTVSEALNAVTAISANNVWAVGSGGLIEHWDGTSWTVTLYLGQNSTWTGSLNAISAVSASDIWAVGEVYDSTAQTWQSVSEHWDGTSWSAVANPVSGPTGGACTAQSVELNGVTAVASNDVWAVGYDLPSCGTEQPITEHWDGSAWTVVSNPGANARLNGVAATASNDVWAVGVGTSALVEHWDGATWSIVSVPTPSTSSELDAVTIVSASDVWAIGSFTTYGQTSLFEHWNGTSWSNTQIPPNPQCGSLLMTGAAAVSTSDVWTVGSCLGSGGSWLTFAEHYGT